MPTTEYVLKIILYQGFKAVLQWISSTKVLTSTRCFRRQQGQDLISVRNQVISEIIFSISPKADGLLKIRTQTNLALLTGRTSIGSLRTILIGSEKQTISA